MTDNAMKDRDFVEYVVKMLVDNPDDVKVERKIDEMGVLITLDVNPQDMGMVIGREGMTAKALRTLLRVIGARNSARVNLKINEPEGSLRPAREPRESFAPAADTPKPVEEKKTLDDVMNDIRL
ncbi:MAG: KH domain-containing protein [Candidatus Moraniibacteriota bacterium]